ncbi:hypothetical protein FQR65_LT11791 [Abscondita terminalis]|nr:hypothetical protein FQR65_LT11791 [Abscondita terminalis]
MCLWSYCKVWNKTCCDKPLTTATNLQDAGQSVGNHIQSKHSCNIYADLLKDIDIINELKLSNKLLLEKVVLLEEENSRLKSINKNLVKVNKQTNIGNQVCNDEEKPTKCVSVPIKVNTVNITDDSIHLNDTNKLDCSAANSNVDMNSELYLNEYKWTDVVNKKRKKPNNVGNSYQSMDGVAPENKNFIKNKTIRGSASWADDNFCADPRKCWIYLGRAKHEATNGVISSYLQTRFPNEKFIIEKLENKSKYTASFKIGANFELLDKLNDPSVWPSEIVVCKLQLQGSGSSTPRCGNLHRCEASLIKSSEARRIFFKVVCKLQLQGSGPSKPRSDNPHIREA